MIIVAEKSEDSPQKDGRRYIKEQFYDISAGELFVIEYLCEEQDNTEILRRRWRKHIEDIKLARMQQNGGGSGR